jgi:DNA-binding MarR family transcriptional regulator
MKIKKELGVESFRNIWEKTQINLEFTYKHTEYKTKQILGNHGITYQQMRFLQILSEEDNCCNLKTIRERLLDRNADVSRLAHRMIAKGWVRQSGLKKDRRNTMVEITEVGKEKMANIEKDLKLIDRIFYNLSKKEAKQLNALLDKVRA